MNGEVTAKVYEIDLQARSENIDFMGHVNNSVFLNWIEEAVISHWRSIAPRDALPRYLWVAIRHEIDYLKPVFEGNHLRLRHQFEALTGVRATSLSRIFVSDKLAVQARSIWCSVDAVTQKPRRLAGEFLSSMKLDAGLTANSGSTLGASEMLP